MEQNMNCVLRRSLHYIQRVECMMKSGENERKIDNNELRWPTVYSTVHMHNHHRDDARIWLNSHVLPLCASHTHCTEWEKFV